MAIVLLVSISVPFATPVFTGRESIVLGQSTQWDVDDEPSIAQAVVSGNTLPAQNIRYITSVPQTFNISIKYGDAYFVGGGSTYSVTLTAPGWLVQPAIIPGALDDESYVVFNAINGATIESAADTRVVLSVNASHITDAYSWIPTTDPSYLNSDTYYYVNDLRLVTDTRGVVLTGGESNTLAVGKEKNIHGRKSGTTAIANVGGINSPNELCIRAFTGPGKVFWDFTNKTPRSAGFSVKPESSVLLVWGAAPSQDVDGIYKVSWGCCKAFKIPDSCDVHYTSSGGSWQGCCNAAALKIAKKKPAWVDPCKNDKPEKDWVDCPLCE